MLLSMHVSNDYVVVNATIDAIVDVIVNIEANAQNAMAMMLPMLHYYL